MSTRILRQALLACVVALAVPSVHCEESPLPGWSRHPKPKENSEDMFCGNYSRMRWQVVASGSGVRITRWSYPVLADLPFHLDETTFSARKSARRHVLQVDDGWIIGFDAGEYLGSLWWLSHDGSKQQRLDGENVQGIAQLGTRIFVLTGLAHMGIDTGHALELAKGVQGGWRVASRTDLGATPFAFAVEAESTIICVTTSGVRRLEVNSRSVKELSHGDIGSLYPVSVAVLPSGEIYVGMNLYVMRLTPSKAGYREEWFVPKECVRHEIKGLDCVCLGDKAAE